MITDSMGEESDCTTEKFTMGLQTTCRVMDESMGHPSQWNHYR